MGPLVLLPLCFAAAAASAGTFSLAKIPNPGDLGGIWKFHGAAVAPNGAVVFAPEDVRAIGVFEPDRKAFSYIPLRERGLVESGIFHGAVTAHNGLVVLVPWYSRCVGLFDAARRSFECVDISATIDERADKFANANKFDGAALAPGGLVVFAPFRSPQVGIFDAASRRYRVVDIRAALRRLDLDLLDRDLFSGCATAGNGLVVMAPNNAEAVGLFDVASDEFSLVDVRSQLRAIPQDQGYNYFSGAVAAPDGRVVFVPWLANAVGIFDATSRRLTLVPIVRSYPQAMYKFSGGAAVGDAIVFAPHGGFGDPPNVGVGVFNTTSLTFAKVDIGIQNSFQGAAVAQNGQVIFAPSEAEGVGIFSLRSPRSAQQPWIELVV